MSTARHCKVCGAVEKKKGMSSCWGCGTPYSFGEDRELPPKGARFASVEEVSGFSELLERKPRYGYALAVLSKPVVIGVVLVALARLARGFLMGPEDPTWKTVIIGVPLFVVMLVGVGLVLWGLVRLFQFLSAPLVRRPALVTRKRTLKEGGDIKAAQGKPLILHLEFRTENRDIVRAKGGLATNIAVDDIGVAYVKAPFLLDFRKLDV